MQRNVSAHLGITVTTPATLAFMAALAEGADAVEQLELRANGEPVRARELHGEHGNRIHVFDAVAGTVTFDYTARVDGTTPPMASGELDLLTYVKPSRYCESDTLTPTAQAEFAGLSGRALLGAVSSWVGTRLQYEPGSSSGTDGAVATLLARRGVCRDYAHLVVALLRALDVPARLVAVYAPGLQPMDFHAVAEAFIDGAWQVVDATALAPRQSLVRIATGRDAADTAFLSVIHGLATLDELEVAAVVDELPRDDVWQFVELS